MSDTITTQNEAPSIPLFTPVCIRFFDDALEEDLHRGIITGGQGDDITIQAIDVASAARHTPAELYYRDENHQFVRAQAVLTGSELSARQAAYQMSLTSEQGAYAEQRSRFRVSVAD